jgi:hypothetical protein
MGFFHWLQENWLDLFQTAAIVGGFVAMGRDRRKEKVQNRIYFTERHGELSRREVYDPKLSRIALTFGSRRLRKITSAKSSITWLQLIMRPKTTYTLSRLRFLKTFART